MGCGNDPKVLRTWDKWVVYFAKSTVWRKWKQQLVPTENPTAGCACFVPVSAILLTACFDVNSFL